MRKERTKLIEKFLEKHLDEFVPASPAEVAVTRARVAKLKAEKAAKDARFTTRLSQADFEGLKQAAAREGMGYQTLLGSIIHKYLEGNLVDINEARKILRPGKKSRVI